tara:strand:+ start:451 stop:597 length:147 start_codon:yes stop_codon:yes gene_type:complete
MNPEDQLDPSLLQQSLIKQIELNDRVLEDLIQEQEDYYLELYKAWSVE